MLINFSLFSYFFKKISSLKIALSFVMRSLQRGGAWDVMLKIYRINREDYSFSLFWKIPLHILFLGRFFGWRGVFSYRIFLNAFFTLNKYFLRNLFTPHLWGGGVDCLFVLVVSNFLWAPLGRFPPYVFCYVGVFLFSIKGITFLFTGNCFGPPTPSWRSAL